MRKQWLVCCAIMAMLVCAGVVCAEVRTFSKIHVDVPSGWTAQEDGSVVALLAPGNAAALSIALDSAQGASAMDLAKAMSQQLNGSTPVAEGDGGFTFTFTNPQGVESTSILYVENNEFVMLTITGEHPQIEGILDSIQER